MSIHSPDIQALDWNQIESGLSDNSVQFLSGHQISSLVDSTNSRALLACQNSAALPMVFLAEQQTSGRGRHGRQWISPRAQNIYMSLVSRIQLPLDRLSGLSVAIGVELVRMLKHYGVNAALKWPNDVQVNGHKLAGILVETRIKSDNQICAVMGVGLNYRMQDVDAREINQDWIDLDRVISSEQLPRRNQVAADLINALVTVSLDFAEAGLAGWMEDWRLFDLCFGREIEVIECNQRYRAVGLGINELGGLQLQVGEDMKIVYSSDVSIRLIH